MTEDIKLCRNKLHPLTAENLKPKSDGTKECRACWRVATQRYRDTPAGRLAVQRANTRYDHSSAGMLRAARRHLRDAEAR